MRHEWTTILTPVEHLGPEKRGGDDVKVAGVAVVITDGETRHEVSRISYDRSKSKHKRVSFEEQLTAEIAKADAAVGALNDLGEEEERLLELARETARTRIREVLGRPSRSTTPE